MVSTLRHLSQARRLAQARKRKNNPCLLIIEVLGGVVVLAEVSAAIAQLLHLQESSAILNLASTALGGLIGFLVNPNISGRVLGVIAPKTTTADGAKTTPAEGGSLAGQGKGNDVPCQDEA